jgi:hypothetical protein
VRTQPARLLAALALEARSKLRLQSSKASTSSLGVKQGSLASRGSESLGLAVLGPVKLQLELPSRKFFS